MSNKMGVTGILIVLLCVGKIQADKVKPNMQCSSKDLAEINLCSMALWRSLDDICSSSPVSLFRSTASWFAVLGQFEQLHHNLDDYRAIDTTDEANKKNVYTSQTVKEAKQANTLSGQNANDAEAKSDKTATGTMNGLTCKRDSAQELQAICREFKSFKSCVGDIGVDSRCKVHPKLFAIKLAFEYVCGEGNYAATTQKCLGGGVTMVQLCQTSTKHEDCVSRVKGPYYQKRNSGLQASYGCICSSVDQFLRCLALGALVECGEEGQRLFEGYRQHALAAVADHFPDLDHCRGKPPRGIYHALQRFLNVVTKFLSDPIKAMTTLFRSQADKAKPNMQCSSKDRAEINLCSMPLWRSLDDICSSSPVSLLRLTASWFAVLGQFDKLHHNLADYIASDKSNKRTMYTSQTVKERNKASTISGQNANDAEVKSDKPASGAMNGPTCKTDSAQELQAICREFKSFKSCVGDIGVDIRCEVHPKLFAIKLAFEYVCGEGNYAATTQKCLGGVVTTVLRCQTSRRHENCVSSIKGPYSQKRNSGLQPSYGCICTSVDRFLGCLAHGAMMECGMEGQRLFEGYRQHALAAVADLFPHLDHCRKNPSLGMVQRFLNVGMKFLSGMIKVMTKLFRS